LRKGGFKTRVDSDKSTSPAKNCQILIMHSVRTKRADSVRLVYIVYLFCCRASEKFSSVISQIRAFRCKIVWFVLYHISF